MQFFQFQRSKKRPQIDVDWVCVFRKITYLSFAPFASIDVSFFAFDFGQVVILTWSQSFRRIHVCPFSTTSSYNWYVIQVKKLI